MCSTPSPMAIERLTERISIHTIEFPYTRTLGPVYGAFLTGLRDGRLLGIRAADGRVLMPPTEWDPATGEPLDLDFVEVGPGEVLCTLIRRIELARAVKGKTARIPGGAR